MAEVMVSSDDLARLGQLRERLSGLIDRLIGDEGFYKGDEGRLAVELPGPRDHLWDEEPFGLRLTSYHLDFETGGRHHEWKGVTFRVLLDRFEQALQKEEETHGRTV